MAGQIKILEKQINEQVSKKIKKTWFKYVTVELKKTKTDYEVYDEVIDDDIWIIFKWN